MASDPLDHDALMQPAATAAAPAAQPTLADLLTRVERLEGLRTYDVRCTDAAIGDVRALANRLAAQADDDRREFTAMLEAERQKRKTRKTPAPATPTDEERRAWVDFALLRAIDYGNARNDRASARDIDRRWSQLRQAIERIAHGLAPRST